MSQSLEQVSALGQSVWVDFLSRQALEDGTIERLMRQDAVVRTHPRQCCFLPNRAVPRARFHRSYRT